MKNTESLSTRIRRIATLANLVSVSRIALAPLLLLAISLSRYLESALLLSLVCVTDVVDGRIARATGTTSEFGAALDVAADCIVTFSCQSVLVAAGAWPPWLLALTVISLVVFLASVGLKGAVSPNRVGRTVGATTMVGLLLVLACLAVGPAEWDRLGGAIYAAVAVHHCLAVAENFVVRRERIL